MDLSENIRSASLNLQQAQQIVNDADFPSREMQMSTIEGNKLAASIEALLPAHFALYHRLDFSYRLTLPWSANNASTTSASQIEEIEVIGEEDITFSTAMCNALLKAAYGHELWNNSLTNSILQPLFDNMGLSADMINTWKINRTHTYRSFLHGIIVEGVCEGIALQLKHKVYEFISKSLAEARSNTLLIQIGDNDNTGKRLWIALFEVEDIVGGKIDPPPDRMPIPHAMDRILSNYLPLLDDGGKLRLFEVLFESLSAMPLALKTRLLNKFTRSAVGQESP